MSHPDASAPEWPWPEALDAVQAAPAFHHVLLENAAVRVLETRVAPGEYVPVHTHRWPSVTHLLRWSDFVRRDHTGALLLDTRGQPTPAVPSVTWAPPLPPHSLENVGTEELHAVSIEIKRSASTITSRGA